jgi:hypothetical protein
VNAVFLLRDRPWSVDELQLALSRAGLAVETAGEDRLVLRKDSTSRVYLGSVTELDLGLEEAFGPVEPGRLLEVDYTSKHDLYRVLEPIAEDGPVVVDNDYDFHGPLSELLAAMAEAPDRDWRTH